MRRGNQEHCVTVVSVPAMLGDGGNAMSNGTVPKEYDHEYFRGGGLGQRLNGKRPSRAATVVLECAWQVLQRGSAETIELTEVCILRKLFGRRIAEWKSGPKLS